MDKECNNVKIVIIVINMLDVFLMINLMEKVNINQLNVVIHMIVNLNREILSYILINLEYFQVVKLNYKVDNINNHNKHY